ncbi:MAG: ATP-binding cassette domain-containing protein [Candidatus Heimdallarchaeota archaeon]|nr:ATP-binding cassette domain-containing protein [Candidatus Heimdallarchaeota archaeon]
MSLRHRGKYRELADDKGRKKRVASDWILAKWILGYLEDYKGLVFLAVVLILGSTGFGLISPYISKGIIDEGFGENPTVTGDYQKLVMYVLALLGITIALALINLFKSITLYKIGFNSVRKIRKDTFSKLQSLSMNYFDKHGSGAIISRVTNDCDKVNELMSGSIITSFTDFVTIIGVAIILLIMNWELALICLGLSIPPIIIISYFFKIRARKAYRKTRKTIESVTSNLSETIDGVKVSKTFSQEKKKMDEFKKANLANQRANLRAEAIFAVVYPIFSFISSAVVGLVYVYTGWTIYFSGVTIHVPISIGEAIAFTQYIGLLFSPILNLTMFYNTFQSTMAATERIYELNTQKSRVEEKEDAMELKDIKGDVRFKDVDFSYVKGEPVLQKFNLDVEPGESIAIVGPTGAGKTTIMNLLARFYEVKGGKITIDGTNIQDVTLKSLHKQMGIVLQDPFLFSGTIKENIAYGKDNATDEEIELAAKLVNAHDFIKFIPDGYDSFIGEEGKRLSVGQRQLISFARAIIDNPKILILDEATSSVDPYTEMLIKDAMSELLRNRTSFIIAHRLSTVRNADRIIVLKKGKIVEEGCNEELLARKGEYYRLYTLQFKDQEEDQEEKDNDS